MSMNSGFTVMLPSVRLSLTAFSRYLISLAIALLCMPSSAIPGQAQTADALPVPQGARQTHLTGSIEVSATLPALDSSLSPGNRYDPTLLGLDSPSSRWITIPAWLAGEWHLNKVVFHSLRPTGGPEELAHDITENEPPLPSIIFGQQIDRSGAIWHFIGVPTTKPGLTRTVTSGVRFGGHKALFTTAAKTIDQRYDVISEISNCETTDSDSFCFLESMISLTTRDPIETIKEVHQEQVLFKYSKDESGNNLKANLVSRTFSSQGVPTQTQLCENHYARLSPFKTVDKQGDLDLHELFVAYLKNIGREDLLP